MTALLFSLSFAHAHTHAHTHAHKLCTHVFKKYFAHFISFLEWKSSLAMKIFHTREEIVHSCFYTREEIIHSSFFSGDEIFHLWYGNGLLHDPGSIHTAWTGLITHGPA